MSASENKSEGHVQDDIARLDVVVKPEPVDENNYTSLPVQDSDFTENITVKIEPRTRIKIEPSSDQNFDEIKQRLTAEDVQDAEPICSSELPKSPVREARPKMKAENASEPNIPDNRPTFYDLTTEDGREAQAWDVLNEINEAAKAARLAKLGDNLRVDGTERLMYGSSRKRTVPETKTTRQLNEEKRLQIDGTEKLGALNPFYKPSDFATRIGPKPKPKDSSKQVMNSRAYSGAFFYGDDKYHPAVRGSASGSLRRSERTISQRLERVTDTHDTPRVDKSVKPKRAPTGEQRHDTKEQRSIKNGSPEAKGNDHTNFFRDRGTVTEDDGKSCLCRRSKGGEMIYCDGETCDIRWYHLECIRAPTQLGGNWYCDRCTKLMDKATARESSDSLFTQLDRARYGSTGGRRSTSGASSNGRRARSSGGARSASRTRYVRTSGKAYQRTTTGLGTVSEEDVMDI